jgi:hypothetical protein
LAVDSVAAADSGIGADYKCALRRSGRPTPVVW